MKTRRALLRENAAREHVLYRLYDADENLLYVGITFMLDTRMNTHSREKRWWGQVARRDTATFPDRRSALHAERVAIKSENPLHNSQRPRPRERDAEKVV